jgi:hypothetical protein
MKLLRPILGGIVFAAALGAAPVRAQQQQGQQPDAQQPDQSPDNNPSEPIPAIRSPLAGAAGNGQADTDQGPLQPDTRSVTGVEPVGIGSPAMTHNYWAPRIAIAATADSNPDYNVGNDAWTGWISLVGGIDVHKSSGGSDLLLSYTGGGMFTNGQNVDNGIIQQLSLRDRFLFHRSTFTVFEQLAYLPETSLGFAGTAGSGVPGLGGTLGGGTGYTPGQSILTPRGQNLTSSTAGEWDYQLSRRASITLVGSYSLLRYFDEDLANYGDAAFQAGYNYQLTRHDTIAVSYQFSAFRYSNLGQSINSNVVQGVYSRRVTGRLGFQVAAGPQYITSNTAITGLTPTATPGSISSLYWTLNSSLTYALRRATFSGSYNHGVTGGSGVLVGAETDIVSGAISGHLARTLGAGVNFGYSRNDGFLVGDATQSQTYDYWFAGANVTHTMGRSMDLFGNYQLQYQRNGANGCVGPGCSADVVRNQFSIGVNFHKQPIPF